MFLDQVTTLKFILGGLKVFFEHVSSMTVPSFYWTAFYRPSSKDRTNDACDLSYVPVTILDKSDWLQIDQRMLGVRKLVFSAEGDRARMALTMLSPTA